MDAIKKNTVPAENQMARQEMIFFEKPQGKGKRILFVGNSITVHGLKPEIGWFGDNFGMAASKKEKDYVHLMINEITKKDPEATFCVCQAVDWERNYKTGNEVLSTYEKARDFCADVMIMRLIENCPVEAFDRNAFAAQYKGFIDYLNFNGNAKIILTTGFWKHPGDEMILQIGKESGYSSVYLGELGEDPAMKALGKFEHEGVANHPGDAGMKRIAEMLLDAF